MAAKLKSRQSTFPTQSWKLSTLVREFLTNESRVSQATRVAVQRRGYSYTQRTAFIAQFLGFHVDSSDLRRVSDRLVDHLLASSVLRLGDAEESVVRQKILAVIMKYLEGDPPFPARPSPSR